MRDVEVQPPLVDPLALAEREEVELVVVVGDERDVRLDLLPVDLSCRAASGRVRAGRARAGGRGPRAVAVPLASVDELRVEPERDVVQEHVAVHPSDVDPLLASVRERGQSRRSGRRGRARRPGRSGCASRTGSRRTAGRARARPRRPGRASRRRLPSRVRRRRRRAPARRHRRCPRGSGRGHPALLGLLAQVVGGRPVVAGPRVDQQESGHASSIAVRPKGAWNDPLRAAGRCAGALERPPPPLLHALGARRAHARTSSPTTPASTATPSSRSRARREAAGSDHAAEEAAHVDLWDDFARALDADLERAPRAETRECVDAWTAAPTPRAPGGPLRDRVGPAGDLGDEARRARRPLRLRRGQARARRTSCCTRSATSSTPTRAGRPLPPGWPRPTSNVSCRRPRPRYAGTGVCWTASRPLRPRLRPGPAGARGRPSAARRWRRLPADRP